MFLEYLNEIYLIVLTLGSLVVFTYLFSRKKDQLIIDFRIVGIHIFVIYLTYLYAELTKIFDDTNFILLTNKSNVLSTIGLISILKVFLVLVFLISIIVLINYNKIHKNLPFEIFHILSFFIIGLLLLMMSNDFLIMFLGLELQSFSLYILIGLKQKTTISTETSIKYYILGSISSALILFGCSLIYAFLWSFKLF